MRLTWWGGKLLSDSKVFLSGHCNYREDQLGFQSSGQVNEYQGEGTSKRMERESEGRTEGSHGGRDIEPSIPGSTASQSSNFFPSKQLPTESPTYNPISRGFFPFAPSQLITVNQSTNSINHTHPQAFIQ
jgi:hypothetical protein